MKNMLAVTIVGLGVYALAKFTCNVVISTSAAVATIIKEKKEQSNKIRFEG